jgi:hypothetical protein
MAEDEPATSATNTNPVTTFRIWFVPYEMFFLQRWTDPHRARALVSPSVCQMRYGGEICRD